MSNVVDIMVFLTDMKNDFKKFNSIYSEYLEGYEATRTTVEVASLPTPISVEFKVVAKK
jgi:2-aminomuconate deaminase